jgi:hypothetical protein
MKRREVEVRSYCARYQTGLGVSGAAVEEHKMEKMRQVEGSLRHPHGNTSKSNDVEAKCSCCCSSSPRRARLQVHRRQLRRSKSN